MKFVVVNEKSKKVIDYLLFGNANLTQKMKKYFSIIIFVAVQSFSYQ